MSVRSAAAMAVALAGIWAPAAPSVAQAAPAPSGALGPGVYVDPGSPAGKEYTAPLSALRGQASGHPGGRDQSEPLFGIGITPAGASERAGTRAGPPPRRGRVGASAGYGRGPGAAGRSGGASRAQRAALLSLTQEGSAAPSVGFLAAAVVLGGLALGALLLVVRRRLA